ncbi:MAG TPA: hypothetical protein VKV32_03235 [Stellaceae bacterium]|nr:hypothetical protein [Stellaceae bacterium]
MHRNASLIATISFVVAALTCHAIADPAIKILIPSDDNCAAYVTAMNSDDRAAMLSLGGWALGYWSALAEQSGKDLLRDASSEALLDKLATLCQAQPNTPMSSIVETIGRELLAGQAL